MLDQLETQQLPLQMHNTFYRLRRRSLRSGAGSLRCG